jgi:hypothetical protein
MARARGNPMQRTRIAGQVPCRSTGYDVKWEIPVNIRISAYLTGPYTSQILLSAYKGIRLI